MKFPIHVCTAENFHHYLNYNFVNNVMFFLHEKLRYFSLIYAPMAIFNNGDHYNSLYEADQK